MPAQAAGRYQPVAKMPASINVLRRFAGKKKRASSKDGARLVKTAILPLSASGKAHWLYAS